jgi:hypothetical protein
MSVEHSWWAELRHGGCLITPSRLAEHFPESLDPLPRHLADRLRRDVTALDGKPGERLAALLDTVLESILELAPTEWAKANAVPAEFSVRSVTGEVIKPRRLWRGSNGGILPVFVDSDGAGHRERMNQRLGIGRGRRAIARVNEWLRKRTDARVALLTNGSQWRLIHAGQDYDAWCEWDIDLWFSEGVPSQQVTALRALMGRAALTPPVAGEHPPLINAILDSRKGQSELSASLGERVRQAIELLISESRSAIEALEADPVHSAPRRDIYIAATRMIMRCVVVLFAEARDLLPRNNPIYHSSYGIQGLREQLERDSSGGRGYGSLRHRVSAWPRLLALFRLIYEGSEHEAMPIMRYGGELFRPGSPKHSDPVLRALSTLESPRNELSDATVATILDCLTRAPIRVRLGRTASIVNAPVDFSQLDTEYIGILYQGLLDYELRKADRVPLLFLNLGDQPALPLDRLESMDDAAIRGLVEKMAKSSKLSGGDDNAADEEEEFDTDDDAEIEDDLPEEQEVASADALHDESDETIANRTRAQTWARRAVVAGNLVSKPRGNLTAEKRRALEDAITAKALELIAKDVSGRPRIIAHGEYFLVRWGGTRKGTGTFYTKPALAGPTVRRTLEPLCYEEVESEKQVRKPAVILGLKVADIAVGSGSFVVASLRYLTEALYESLFAHRWLKTDDDARIVTDTPPEPIPPWLLECTRDLPLTTDDPEAAVKARLRRIIVERCIYGVDLDALAVELCRLSLWIETMDYQLPFSFLDHKIKVGNGLVGCWFDRFQDYPAMAWEREGGDKNHTNFVHHFHQYEVQRGKKKGEVKRDGNVWTEALKRFKEEVVKPELKQLIEALDPNFRGQLLTDFQLQESPGLIHEEAVRSMKALHEQRLTDPEAQRKAYEEHFENNPHIQTLRCAFDTWCAAWFWPADRLDIAPSPSRFFDPPSQTHAIVEQLRDQHRFFHWEIEFPDVFDQPRAGFSAVVGNPPWEIQKPNSKEFFSNVDPLFRTYGKQEAIAKQREYFQIDSAIERNWLDYSARLKAMSNWTRNAGEPFGNELGPDEGIRFTFTRSSTENQELHELWARVRARRSGFADPRHPYTHQGSADINTYKMFLEQSHALLRPGGFLGYIVPSGLYTDRGCTSLRRLFLDGCVWEWLFSFDNRSRIFSDVDDRFKFCPVIIQKGGKTKRIQTAFMRRVVDDWERAEQYALAYPRERIQQFSPVSFAVLEISSSHDLEILQRMYENGLLLGTEEGTSWRVRYGREFDMANDSNVFRHRLKWESCNYIPDKYGHWIKGNWQANDSPSRAESIQSRDGTQSIEIDKIEDVALPLYQGLMIWNFDHSAVVHQGIGNTRKSWVDNSRSNKIIQGQFLIGMTDVLRKSAASLLLKVHNRRIQNTTNKRTMVAAVIPGFPAGDTVSRLAFVEGLDELVFAGLLNAFPVDFVTRKKVSQNHVDLHYIVDIPLPKVIRAKNEIAAMVASLSFCGEVYAPHFVRFRPELKSWSLKPWRALWAVTELERLRLRCMLDAVVAELYHLTVKDYHWLLRDCDHPNTLMASNAFTRSLDPKGFWRVDKEKPPELRHTVLAQVAFHDLRRMGIESFLAQNEGEGWMLPQTLRLSDYGLGHDDRARQPQPVASQLGPRFLPWQINEDIEQSWEECRRHAENIRAIRSRFAPIASASAMAAEPEPSQPVAVDLLGEPINTDLFGNEIPPSRKRRRT